MEAGPLWSLLAAQTIIAAPKRRSGRETARQVALQDRLQPPPSPTRSWPLTAAHPISAKNIPKQKLARLHSHHYKPPPRYGNRSNCVRVSVGRPSAPKEQEKVPGPTLADAQPAGHAHAARSSRRDRSARSVCRRGARNAATRKAMRQRTTAKAAAQPNAQLKHSCGRCGHSAKALV